VQKQSSSAGATEARDEDPMFVLIRINGWFFIGVFPCLDLVRASTKKY
jgi:hypothetical protein